MRQYRCVSVMLLILAVATGAPIGEARSDDFVTFDVPGRPDSTPWIAAAGRDVVVAWGASADGKTDVFVARSHDAGRTFGAPVRVNDVPGEARLGGELPPRVAFVTRRRPGSSTSAKATVDRSDTSASGRSRVRTAQHIVVLYTTRSAMGTAIKLARSQDGGRTFARATPLQSGDAAGDRGWTALAVDAKGEAHAVWLDHRGQAPRRAATGARHVHGSPRSEDGVAFAQRSALYHARAATGSREQPIASGVCYCCKTALAAGPGNVLVAAWRHVYPGNLRDMALSVSRDGGRTFSAPARVSEDGWAIDGCPDDGPSVVVDGSGTTHIVWPTVMGGDQPQGALFYASTRDGRQFTPRVRIPTLGGLKPTHPQIAMGADDQLVVAWDERREGRTVSVARSLLPGANGVRFGEPTILNASGDGHHPVVASTEEGYVGAWATSGEDSTVRVRRFGVR